MPPTGQEVTVTEMTLDRFANGKLVGVFRPTAPR